MRLVPSFILVLGLCFGCKTSRESLKSVDSPNSIENEDQLPACDKLTVGRVYWVRSLDMQMLCEGGSWKPRQVDPDSKQEGGFGPRGL